MDVSQVPQENNKTLEGQRKAMYAKDAQGRIVQVPSKGWEAEEIVTCAAVEHLQELAQQARLRVQAGLTAPLEYWMYAKRMDVAILSQTSDIWRWRIHRHFRPSVFNKLTPSLLHRYAQALGITVCALKQLP